jgi:predicted pyridoxine 5'-phosphate oxidase superfamily flavin-nucleotide-binding protein
MRLMIREQMPLVVTASKDGIPNGAPKGSLKVFDDETLHFAEGAAQKTYRNLQENPQVSVMVVDRPNMDGYQFKGTAELLYDGELYEITRQKATQHRRPIPTCVVKVHIKEIYSIKPRMTAKPIA